MDLSDGERADAESAHGPLSSVLDWVENILAVLAGAMIVFAMLTVTTDVVLRIFRLSLWWSFEVTEFILVYVPLLTLPWLVRRRGHIVIDIVTSRVPPRVARAMDQLSSALAAAVSLFVAYWGAIATYTAYARGIVNAGMVEYPRWALLIAIPVGFGLAAIEFGRVMSRTARK